MTDHPAARSIPVTPSDTVALALLPNRLYVGGAGNVTLRAYGSSADVTYTAVPAGSYLEVRAQYVRATGTTATGIVAEGEADVTTGVTRTADPTPPTPAPALRFGPLTPQAEGNTGSTTWTATLFLDRDGSASSHTVAWAVEGRGPYPALAAVNFGGTFPSGSVTFASGESSKTITFTSATNTVPDYDRMFQVVATASGVRTGRVTGSISDDDLVVAPIFTPPTGGGTPTPTFRFPAVQAKMAAGQRAQIGIVGDSAVAGWGSGVAVGTGSGSSPGGVGNYLRAKSWPQQLADALKADGVKVRKDAYFSCSSGTVTAELVSANPNLALGSGWVLGNLGLSGTILQCPNTSTAACTFTPEENADSFDFLCSSQAGTGTIVVSDGSGWSQTIDTANQSGAQVIVGAFGLKRFTVTRPTASKTPISFARNGTGSTVYVQGIIPYDSTNPMLEILNMGWPGSRAYGTDGSTAHWNNWAVPSNMNASTPYNALGVLACDAYIIELGTNDAAGGIAASDFQTAITNIATKLKTQAGGNGANVALVKCRVTIGSYAGFNMSAASLAALDTVTASLNLNTVIDFNSIAFNTTTDRFDGTHLSEQGYAKEVAVVKPWLRS